MDSSIQIARRPDRMEVVRLLDRAGLPSSDLTDAHLEHFFYAGPREAPIGIVGVQLFGRDALLRSLVVTDTHRSRGLGQRLVQCAEQHALAEGVTTLFLLTTTAEAFFRARGYVLTSRDDAPAAIRSTPEFSSLCPVGSAFLSKVIQARSSS